MEPVVVAPERGPAPADQEMQAVRATGIPPTFQLPPDLVQVETSPGKIQQIRDNPPPEAEERFEGRARRPRPPDEPLPSEPLVQVETRQ